MPSQTAVISVPILRTMSFSGSPLAINAGAAGNLVLNLGGQAPPRGLIVNLISSDPSKATVPSTVSFATGATSMSIPITGIAPGSVVISANAPNVHNATATVTVGGKP